MGSEKVPVLKAGAMGGPAPPQPGPAGEKAWWLSFLILFLSGAAWVASIPLLLLSLGGCLQPHMGWLAGLVTAACMFAVLVQVDQRIAAAVVFGVTLSSAWLATTNFSLAWGMMATGMTMLNAVQRVCRPCPRLLDLQCRYYRGYHKRCELGGDLDSVERGRSFFACHPHGMLSAGWIANVVWGRRFHHAVGRCYYLIDPTLRNKGLFARLFCDAFEGPHGGLRDTNKGTIERLMKRGESVSMIPGAYQEATLYKNGKDCVSVMQRKGFVKMCLRHGYRVHPVYTFGESDTYLSLGGFEQFRLWLNRKGIPTVAFWGLAWCPLLPRTGCELLTYVGEPVVLPKIAEPTAAQVDEWHGKYVQALREVFDKYKAEAGRPDAKLEVF